MRSIVGLAVKEYNEEETNLRRSSSWIARTSSNSSEYNNNRSISIIRDNNNTSTDEAKARDTVAHSDGANSSRDTHLSAKQIREAAMNIKREQIKALIKLLTDNNITVEDFMKLDDESQKKKLTSIARGTYYAGLDELRFHSSNNTLHDIIEYNKQLTPLYQRAVTMDGTVSHGRLFARHLPTEIINNSNNHADLNRVILTNDKNNNIDQQRGLLVNNNDNRVKTVQFADARTRMLEIIRRTPLGNVKDPLLLQLKDSNTPVPFTEFQQQQKEQRKIDKLNQLRGKAITPLVAASATPHSSSHNGITLSSSSHSMRRSFHRSSSGKRIVPRTIEDFSKYFDLQKMGIEKGVIIEKMVNDGIVDSPDEAIRVLQLNPDYPLPKGFFPSDANLGSELTAINDNNNNSNESGDFVRPPGSIMVPAAQHAEFAMFFQMVQMGLPVDAVKEKMKRQGLDESVLDKRPDELLPLKTAVEFMASAGGNGVNGGGFGFGNGYPNGAFVNEQMGVANESIQSNGGFGPGNGGFGPGNGGFGPGNGGFGPGNGGLAPQIGYIPSHSGPYQGVPVATGYPMNYGSDRDGINGHYGDKQAEGSFTGLKSIVPIKEHPLYEKYFRMLHVGMSKDDVKTHMMAVGLDPAMLDKDPQMMVSLIDPTGNGQLPIVQQANNTEPDKEMVKACEHPKYAKFFKMLRVGMPLAVVRMKMETEGLNPNVLEKDPNSLIPLEEEEEKEETVKASEHPRYAKFFKMLKVGMPLMAVKAKVQMEGLDPAIMDKDPNEMIPLADKKETTVLASEHPVYGKYFEMLKDGIAIDAIKKKMVDDGHDPSIIDINPLERIPIDLKRKLSTKSMSLGSIGSFSKSPKKKKLYLKGLDSSRVKDSLWAEQHSEDIGIDLDVEEFNKLFVKPEDDAAAEQKKQKLIRRASISAKKKVVLIDMKRAQNAGIALARIRFSHDDIRKKVKNMDADGITTDQLRSLEEFLPSPEEEKAVRNFVGDVSALGIGEQYMIKMLDLEKAAERIRVMIYKQMFKTRLNECKSNISKIENACDDVKMSGKLKKILKIILKVVNQMNDDDGDKHMGISVESLLKLETTKAFDKKTSVLQYIVALIFRQDKELLKFPEELPYIADASRISLDSIVNDKNNLSKEFEVNFEVVMEIEEKEATYKTGLMVDFLARAEGQCKELEKRCEEVNKKFVNILAYFGADTETTKSTEFFTTLNKFITGFIKVRETVERIHRTEVAAQQAEKQRTLRRSSMAAKTMQAFVTAGNNNDSDKKVENVSPPKNRRRSTTEMHNKTFTSVMLKNGIASIDEEDAADNKHAIQLSNNTPKKKIHSKEDGEVVSPPHSRHKISRRSSFHEAPVHTDNADFQKADEAKKAKKKSKDKKHKKDKKISIDTASTPQTMSSNNTDCSSSNNALQLSPLEIDGAIPVISPPLTGATLKGSDDDKKPTIRKLFPEIGADCTNESSQSNHNAINTTADKPIVDAVVISRNNSNNSLSTLGASQAPSDLELSPMKLGKSNNKSVTAKVNIETPTKENSEDKTTSNVSSNAINLTSHSSSADDQEAKDVRAAVRLSKKKNIMKNRRRSLA